MTCIKCFKPYFHLGLGKMVRNSSELKRLLREGGYDEVGAEDTRKGPTKGLTMKQTKEYYREIQHQKDMERLKNGEPIEHGYRGFKQEPG